jgi:cysteine desulfurase/selenocysteine lyase
VHRGVHLLSERSTASYEGAREKVRRFLNARSVREIIFTRGTTEAINLVAQAWGRANAGAGDEILITALEHHSNIVPWQILAEEKGAALKVAPINDRGEVIQEEYERLLGPRTKIAAFAHISNALGTVNPVRQMIEKAHRRGVAVLIDGAQAAPHRPIDVQALDCEFYAFSGHKTYGPTGIGILYGKEAVLERMPPYQGGGDMIRTVTFEKTTYNDLPYKFEAGTPDIAGAIGLGAAIDYLTELGLENTSAWEADLLQYGTELLSAIPGLRLVGTARNKASVLSFLVDGIHAHDMATILDRQGIAVRAGHHCAQPVMDRFGVPATSRASLAFYNTKEELDTLARGVEKAKEIFR